jgi:phosphatidylglycerophosphatase A
VPWAVVAGFFAFRFFDIFKFGIDWVERLPVGGKVVWDDVLAGVYAGVVVAGVAALA